MLRLSKLTDYATVIMNHLALQPEERLLSANQVAQDTHISPPTVSKLLKILQENNLVNSARGVEGGYQLARSAEKISVAEVITAIEGKPAMTECAAHQGDCAQESVCAVRGNWQLINRVILQALHELTLADMTRALSEQHIIRKMPLKMIRGEHHVS